MILNLKKRLLQKAGNHTIHNPALHSHVIDIVRPDEEALKKIKANNYLASYARNIASQGGEDGVLEKILETIGITKPGWCVEFGACDGKLDSNTWNLVKNHGWKAVYIEPDPTFFPQLQQHCNDTPNTWCFSDMVSWEGESRLDAILARTPIPSEFDFLSIDCDGPDYHIWEALENYHPHVVSIEFNRLINPKVSYFPDQDAPTSRPSSMRALYELGKRKGYELVCEIHWNLFFVRSDHYAKFAIPDNHPEKFFYPFDEMRIFQGYDGTLVLHPIDRHYWKCQRNEEGVVDFIKISQRDIQVLPDGLRLFRPRHTYRSAALEAQAGKLDIKWVPKNTLLKHRKNVTSENGEDGIIEHIFEALSVSRGFCVDIGACDGKKWSNSWNLIANKGWQGLLIEADSDAFKQLTVNYKDNAKASCVNVHVTSETLNLLLDKHKVPQNFDLLTIDVEGNDYHLFAALERYTPTVAVIDFNPSVANDIRFIQENNEQAHYGASLLSLIELASRKGYTLAAVTDWNAIFARNEALPKLGVAESIIDEMYYPPFEMRMFQTLDGCLHLAGCKTLVRQDYDIEWEEFQVLPVQLRGHVNSSKYFEHIDKLRPLDNTMEHAFQLRSTFY